MDGMGEFRKPLSRAGLLLSLLFLTSACSRSIRVPEEGASQDSQAPFEGASGTPSSPQVVQHTLPADAGMDLPFEDAHRLPVGTLLTVRLSNPVTAGVKTNDRSFQAVIDQPVMIDGNTVLPPGSIVNGRVESARTSEMKPDRGYVRLVLASVNFGGVEIPLQTASLFARQGPDAEISLSTVRLEQGRRLTFRLTEPVSLSPQRTQARQ